MTAAFLSALSDLWPYILTMGAVAFGWVRHLQARAAKADAQKEVAEALAKVANVQKSEAEANATAAQAGASASQERVNVENETAALDRSALDERLRRWTED